jgi:hypothetical protein
MTDLMLGLPRTPSAGAAESWVQFTGVCSGCGRRSFAVAVLGARMKTP